jgi:hypothetical protein
MAKEEIKEYQKNWREKNIAKRKEYSKQYYKNNKENNKTMQKKYYENNKEKIQEYQKNNRKNNKEKIQEYQKNYREKNKEKLKNYRENNKDKLKIYCKNNKEKLKIYREKNKEKINLYNFNRRKAEPLIRLKHNLGNRIRLAIKSKNFTKSKRTLDMLGCDLHTAKAHLEKQFTKGMTWDNHGEWHIDHIIPCASAKTEEELIKLFHYTNLQPLWAADNMSKSDKIIEKQLFLL